MKKNVLYLYDEEIGNFFYGPGHPMKPQRVRMTHDLLQGYGILERMELMIPKTPTKDELTRFHADDYVDFLRSTAEPTAPLLGSPHTGGNPHPMRTGFLSQYRINGLSGNVNNFGGPHTASGGFFGAGDVVPGSTTNNASAALFASPIRSVDQLSRFNVGEDCPVFEGLWDYCKMYAGGSIEGARRVVKGEYDYAINWAGGLHHGKKHEASGFCYVNDCVLGALEFLRYKQRVLYVDVDVHHGDGVEEAFYTSPRVLCCSFHKYGHYFPGTGSIDDIGIEEGLGYSVNVPLNDGIDDQMYCHLFTGVMDKIMETYRPEAVVLQCGADSVAGDRLGCFNLSPQGHSVAVRYFMKAGIPALILGGGGYTIRNVPRCWAKETADILGVTLDPVIPKSCAYVDYYGPFGLLDVPTSNMENRNSDRYVETIIQRISESLRQYVHPVGAQIKADSTGDDPISTGFKMQKDRLQSADQHEDREESTGNYEAVHNRERG